MLFFFFLYTPVCWLSQWLKQKRICLSVSRCRRSGFDPWKGNVPWRRKWQATPVLLPGESHGQRSLVSYCPWGSQRAGHDQSLKHHSAHVCNGFFFIIYRVVPLSPQCTWRIFPSSPKESPVLECGQSPPHPHCPASTNLLPASLDLPVLKFKWARIITCVVVFLWPLKTINRVTFF